MTLTFTTAQVFAVVVGAAALLGAIGYLVRVGRKVHRRVMAAARLIDRELTNNHGSSMKDDVHGIAVAVGKLARQVDALEDLPDKVDALSQDLYTHLAEKEPRTP